LCFKNETNIPFNLKKTLTFLCTVCKNSARGCHRLYLVTGGAA